MRTLGWVFPLVLAVIAAGCSVGSLAPGTAPRDAVGSRVVELEPQPQVGTEPDVQESGPGVAAGHGVSPRRLRLIRSFVAFASNPSLPRARQAGLLSSQTVVALRADVQRRLPFTAVADPERWNVLDAHSGATTSALFVIQNNLRRFRAQEATGAPFVASTIAEPLWGQRVARPSSLRGADRVSIQTKLPWRSCLQASRVDVFFLGGRLVGVSLDIWAP